MIRTYSSPPRSLGLRGNEEIVAALKEIEISFCVKFDYSIVDKLVTVGDVFTELLELIPIVYTEDKYVWQRLLDAICWVADVDYELVKNDTCLLIQKRFDWEYLAANLILVVMIILGGFHLMKLGS
jgi:hypothetical protein